MLAKFCNILNLQRKKSTCEIILYDNQLIREPYKEIQFKRLFSQKRLQQFDYLHVSLHNVLENYELKSISTIRKKFHT